jgi:hypothetical protein
MSKLYADPARFSLLTTQSFPCRACPKDFAHESAVRNVLILINRGAGEGTPAIFIVTDVVTSQSPVFIGGAAGV